MACFTTLQGLLIKNQRLHTNVIECPRWCGLPFLWGGGMSDGCFFNSDSVLSQQRGQLTPGRSTLGWRWLGQTWREVTRHGASRRRWVDLMTGWAVKGGVASVLKVLQVGSTFCSCLCKLLITSTSWGGPTPRSRLCGGNEGNIGPRNAHAGDKA